MLKLLLPLLVIFIVLGSCGTKEKYPYAIKDFRAGLRPLLTTLLNKGLVSDNSHDSVLHSASIQELNHAALCEHPLVRAAALRELMNRDLPDHFDIMMQHLDDTAVIAMYAGEFGIWYRTVSDYMLLEHGIWKDSAARSLTVQEVLTKHNYLRAAYIILKELPPSANNYPFIRSMTLRHRNEIEQSGNMGYDDIEYALYGLAKFEKKENIPQIRDGLLQHIYWMSDLSFRLMKEYPDTAYIPVFEKYYRQRFFDYLCRWQSSDKVETFIDAAAVYKNTWSAELLTRIFDVRQYKNCPPDIRSLQRAVAYAVWRNPCDAYAKLKKRTGPIVTEYEKSIISFENNPVDLFPANTAKEPVRWW